MKTEKPLDTNDQKFTPDITLNNDWVMQNVDRLLAWEILKRYLKMDTQEISSEKLCDMIGMPNNFVYEVIKKAKKKCELKNPMR